MLAKKKLVAVLILIVASVLLSTVGCFAQEAVSEATLQSAAEITESLLIGLNEDNYAKFSENFTERMKAAIPESRFKLISKDIKSKIGMYISKEYWDSEIVDGYEAIVYKGKFSEEDSHVRIKVVLCEKDGKFSVSGFWLDSPKLRQ